MTRVQDFIADLAKTGKSAKKIKELTDKAYGDKSLKKTQIYHIISEVKAAKIPATRDF